MASFNKVVLMGRITADPEVKQLPSGVPVVSFTLAVDRKYSKGESKQTDFINCVAWQSTAEFIGKYFTKGMAMLLCGEIQTRSWEDQNGNKRYATEVRVDEVSFCEPKKDEETNYTTSKQNAIQGNVGASTGYMPQAYTQPNFEEVPSGDGQLPF